MGGLAPRNTGNQTLKKIILFFFSDLIIIKMRLKSTGNKEHT